MSHANLESSTTSAAVTVPAVSLEAVSKRYGNLEALAPAAFSVHREETVALLGPSGSGKTTLLTLLSGGLRPDSGRILLDGADLAGMRPGRDLARRVGMVHQQFDLVPNLSALHNVLAGRLGEWNFIRSLISLVVPQDRTLAMQALARVGIADRAPVRASRLSGGEQQRVAIARLLVQDPALILADEPVASLDPARAVEVLVLLVGIARDSGKTLVASMHAVDFARDHFSRLIGLRNGLVQFDLPSSDVTGPMLAALYDLEGLRNDS